MATTPPKLEAILTSSMECNGPKFDCGIAEVRAARSILIVAYTIEMLFAMFVAFGLRRRALLQWAVLSVVLSCMTRIALFALPFYYTIALMRKELGGVVLFLDVLPEGLYYLAVLLIFLSFVAFLRALNVLHLSSGSDSMPAARVLSRTRLWMGTAGAVFILATVGCGIATQLALGGSSWSHWFYLHLDPVLDSIFICGSAALLEALLFGMAFKYPFRLRATLLLALLPAAKGLYGTVEWLVWDLPNLTWMFLWMLYFVITELTPMAIVLVILHIRVRTQRNKRQSPTAVVTEQHPLLYS